MAYKIRLTDKIIRMILFGKKAILIDNKRFVFSPTIYKSLGNHFDVESIDRIWETPSGYAMINDIFAYEKVEIKARVIILDQPRSVLFDTENNNKLNQIYKIICTYFGKENIVLKKHPRSKIADLGDLDLSTNISKVPFEMLCMNNDMSDKVLITHSSTSVTTPKILFNQEPAVIVLNGLVPTIKEGYNFCIDFFKAIHDSYNNVDTFVIPKTMDSLNSIVERFSEDYYDH